MFCPDSLSSLVESVIFHLNMEIKIGSYLDTPLSKDCFAKQELRMLLVLYEFLKAVLLFFLSQVSRSSSSQTMEVFWPDPRREGFPGVCYWLKVPN